LRCRVPAHAVESEARKGAIKGFILGSQPPEFNALGFVFVEESEKVVKMKLLMFNSENICLIKLNGLTDDLFPYANVSTADNQNHD
jgi:hypothetical protein